MKKWNAVTTVDAGPGCAFCALVLSSTGCSDRLPDYVALEHGARWEYAAEVRVGTDTLTGRNVFEIAIEEVSIGDKSYFKTTETAFGFGDQEPVVRYARQTSDAIYELDGQSPEQSEYQLMPLAIEPNEEWAIQTTAGDSLACRAASLEEVDVPAGTYEECLKFVCSGRKIMSGHEAPARIVEYRAPNVGLVKAVTEWGTAVITLRLLHHVTGRARGTRKQDS